MQSVSLEGGVIVNQKQNMDRDVKREGDMLG